jgi:hypothetical protein
MFKEAVNFLETNVYKYGDWLPWEDVKMKDDFDEIEQIREYYKKKIYADEEVIEMTNKE